MLGCLLASLASGADIWSRDGWLIINEVLVLRPRASSERAVAMAQRLSPIPDERPVVVVKAATGVTLNVGETVIITVDAEEARLQNSTPEALAALWATRINDARQLPAMKTTLTRLVLPEGGNTRVSFIGSGARRANLAVNPPDAATIRRETGSIEVKPKGTGQFTLVATNGGTRLTWTFKTLPYASSFGGPFVAEVTGNPANTETVAAAAAAAVQSQMETRDGAMIRLRQVGGAALSVGQKVQVPVEVTVHGEGYFPRSGRVMVEVRNIQASFSRASELWYSNSPENLYGAQPLFTRALTPLIPVRILCHHRNRSAAPLFNTLALLNTSSVPARIALISGDGGVDTNPTLAGYRAGDRFLTSFGSGSALVISLPPGRMLPVHVHEMQLGETSSSLHFFTVLNEEAGDSVKLIQQVVLPDDLPPAWLAASRTDRPYTFTPSAPLPNPLVIPDVNSPTYANPTKREEFRYDFGGRLVFLRIGQHGIVDEEGKPLLGNFGVSYEFRGVLANPTDAAVEIEVAFEASAGYTGCLMFVNGEYMRIPLLQPKEERIFRTVRLQPGQTQTLNITTMPLSGASYPATISIRPKGFQ